MAATIAIVRSLVNDPSGASQVFDDDHYQAIIDLETNEYRAAAAAAKTLAAYYATKVSVSVGPVKVENQQKSDQYLELARSYDGRAREGGGSSSGGGGTGTPEVTGISLAAMSAAQRDTDRPSSAFTMGMFDNPNGTDYDDDDCECC